MDDNKEIDDRLSSFTKASQKMIATNDNAYRDYLNSFRSRVARFRDYTEEELDHIIKSGSLTEQQKLSRNYFYKDGYYKQILLYYATLLTYAGVLIPTPAAGKHLSTPHIAKRYTQAMDFIDKMRLPQIMTNWALRALVDGSYYGVIVQMDKHNFAMLDLPVGYAQSRFKDIYGNDIVEFDVSYFDTITDKDAREQALAAYPQFVRTAYKKYAKAHKVNTLSELIQLKWVRLPADIGVCFPFFDGRPLFLNVIPASIRFKETNDLEDERDSEEIHKFIVQQIPHLSDGRLLFEPPEAAEIHAGTVGMLKGNKNVSVLTTYADTEIVSARASVDNASDRIERSEKDIYAQAGVSPEIFTASGSGSLGTSIKNDVALMMYLAQKFSNFITNIVNQVYSNSNVSFKYQILPINNFDNDSYLDSSFKLVGSGYSFLLPALALGINQKDFVSLKDLENDLLKLHDRLRPLATSYTQSADSSADEGGRPSKTAEQKSEKTIENIESQGNQ